MGRQKSVTAGEILFGLNRAEDERSLAAFLRLFSRDELAGALIPRLSDSEINQIVDLLSSVMRRHLSKEEYHSLFLADPGQPS